jgi:hypothetical protein
MTSAEIVNELRKKYPAIPADADPDEVITRYKKAREAGQVSGLLPGEVEEPTVKPAPVSSPSAGSFRDTLLGSIKPVAPVSAPASSTQAGPEPQNFAQPAGEALVEGAKAVGKKAVSLAKGLVHEVGQDIVSLPKAAATLSEPGALARIYATLKTLPADSPVRQEAEQQLDALARAGAVTASTVAAVFTGGASKTLPWLLRAAAEGGAAGSVYSGTKAGIEGKPAGEVLKETAQGGLTGAIAGPVIAGAGRGVGAIVSKIKGRGVPAVEAIAPEGAAPVEAPMVEAPAAPSILALAEKHNAEVRFAQVVKEYADSHMMEPANLLALVKQENPSIQELASAFDRHGVTAQALVELRNAIPKPLAVPSPAPLAAEAASSPVSQGPLPSEGAPSSVVARLTAAIKAAEPIRAEQTKLYSAERSRRLGAAMGAYKSAGGGAKGYHAMLGQLKGALPKAEFEAVANLFDQESITQLFDQINESKLAGYEKVNAMGALQKMLGMQGVASVPTKSELALLSDVYGPELVEAILAKRPMLAQIGSVVVDVLNVPRSVSTSLDLSAPGRQGLLMVTQPEWWRAWGPMIRSFKSEKFFRAMQDEIEARPSYQTMREAGLALTDIGSKLQPREEAFASSLAERIPVAGRVVRASGRAYTGFLNKLRADVFDRFLKQAAEAGVDVADEAFLKSAAKWINTSTGRGNLPETLQPAAGVLNGVLFSPRLLASRLETFNPRYYATLDPAVRRAAIKANLSAFAAVSSLLGIAAMMPGVKVGLDPRSADFGKARVGNTRLDLFGGHQQIVRASAQLLTGVSVSSTTGREMRLDDNDQYRGLNRWDIIQRFIESKSSPVASFILSMIRGKNMIGEKFDLGKETLARVIPMTIQDTYDAVEEWGPAGALAAIPAGVGLGLQTYARPGDRLHFGQPTIMFKTSRGKTARGLIPRNSAKAYLDEMQGAEARALERLAGSPGFMALPSDRQDARLRRVVEAYRQQVRARWIKQNGALLAKAAATGKSVVLTPPPSQATSLGLDPDEVATAARVWRQVYPEMSELSDAEVLRAHRKMVPEMDEKAYAAQVRRMLEAQSPAAE